MTERKAKIVLDAEDRKLRRKLKSSEREVKQWASSTSSSISNGFKSAFGSIAALGSVGGVAALGKTVLDDSRALTRLGIQANKSDTEIQAFGASMAALSDATGVSTSNLIAGASEIVTLTGDFDLANAVMGDLARTSVATGGDVKDLAGVIAAVNQNMGVAPQDLGKALNILAVQGKAGAVELKDLATLLPSLTPQFNALNVEMNHGTGALAELGAAMQVAKQGFGTAAEAATGMKALMKALVQNSAKFKGVRIFEKDPKTGVKRMREFSSIIGEIAQSKLAKDPTALTKAFGSAEAQATFTQLASKFEDFQELVDKATSGDTINRDFEKYMTSSAGKIEQAWTRMTNSISRQLTPERVDKLADAAIKMADAVGWAADNFGTLAIAFGALKIGQFAVSAGQFAASMQAAHKSSASLGGSIGRAAGGVGKMAANAGAVLSAFTASYGVTTAILDAIGVFEDDTAVKTGVDDPTGAASTASIKAKQDREGLQKLQSREKLLRAGLAKMQAAGNSPESLARMQAQIDEVASQRRFQEGIVARSEAEAVAAKIASRNDARGTGATDDVLAAIRQESAGTFADFKPDLRSNEIISTFAPELQGRSSEELAMIASVLERSLKAHERQTKLLERVAATNGSTPQSTAAVPMTGRAPM